MHVSKLGEGGGGGSARTMIIDWERPLAYTVRNNKMCE